MDEIVLKREDILQRIKELELDRIKAVELQNKALNATFEIGAQIYLLNLILNSQLKETKKEGKNDKRN